MGRFWGGLANAVNPVDNNMAFERVSPGRSELISLRHTIMRSAVRVSLPRMSASPRSVILCSWIQPPVSMSYKHVYRSSA
jgi:hypothetical protein